MKSAHRWPEYIRRKTRANGGVVGKSGVKGTRKWDAVGQAPTPRTPTYRSFRRNMNDIRAQRMKPLSHPYAWRDCQTYLAISRTCDRPELIRADDRDLVAEGRNDASRSVDRPDDAIDLWMPCIGRDGDLHANCFRNCAADC